VKIIENNFESMEVRATKGLVPADTSTTDARHGAKPKYNLELFQQMLLNDPVIFTAFSAVVDVCTVNGYDFFPKKDKTVTGKKQALEAHDKFKYEWNFDEVLDNAILSLLTYGNSFTELRTDGHGSMKEFYALEAKEMGIKFDDHGTIQGFVQEQKGVKVKFTTEEVLFMRLKPFGSKVYGLYPLEPIAKDYATNLMTKDYLSSLLKNIPPAVLYSLENANSTQRKTFIQNLQIAKQNPNADLVAMGRADAQSNLIDFKNGIIEVMKTLRQNVLAITRVPPMWLGILEDQGNRGNSEAQIFAFETFIRKIQSIIENNINKRLEELGYEQILFKFNPFSLKDEKTLLENAEKMMAMGIKKERVADFLTKRGLTISASDIEEKESKDMDAKLKQDARDMARPTMDKKNEYLTVNVDEKGVSDEKPQELNNGN
jgi:hypothetical protein